ncbi:unnamed protein product [Blepharisma stoltei]|uniref:Uncharacterized protein n=1 Tax=Blepharisma stoltei TaxID=1481888 RepID=A0AAU9J179_9CILI|nr:unnamed protein product [Blepharisma stoltei]
MRLATAIRFNKLSQAYEGFNELTKHEQEPEGVPIHINVIKEIKAGSIILEKFMLNQLQSRSASDVIFKCLLGSNSGEDYLEQRLEILEHLVTKLGFEEYPIIPANAELIITRIISTESISVRNHLLLIKFLSSPEVLELLFDNLKTCTNFKPSAKVLKFLIMKNKELQTVGETLISASGVSILETYAENLDVIVHILRNNKNENVKNQAGLYAQPIGEGRILLMETLNLLISFENNTLCDIIAESGAAEALTELFDYNDWNSIFHCTYLNFVKIILLSDSLKLKEALILQAGLPKILMKHGYHPIAKLNPDIRKGKMGHIHKLANLLVRYEIFDLCQINSRDLEDWKSFIKAKIVKQNEIEARELGENNSTYNDSTSDEEPNPDLQINDKIEAKVLEDEPESEDFKDDAKPETNAVAAQPVQAFDKEYGYYDSAFWRIPVMFADVEAID